MPASTLSPSKTSARPRASLAVAMLGFFVVALDAQIVNVALPAGAAWPTCSGLSPATP